MMETRKSGILQVIALLITIFGLSFPAYSKYSSGSGIANDPYHIASPEDLMLLGESPEDYDKHFILTADIDLDPNLPGRKVFDKAVIGIDWKTPFIGVFDGNGRIISHLTIKGEVYLGLFGQLGSGATVKNLGLDAVYVNGTSDYVGGLVGYNLGNVTNCYTTGVVSGSWYVGGLVGHNDGGDVTDCYSSSEVSGSGGVGGLVGNNYYIGSVTRCYSTGTVIGKGDVGGLVGIGDPDRLINCVWDMETSGLTVSAGGMALTTDEMMDPEILGLNGLGGNPNWILYSGRDYPRLVWEGTSGQMIPEPVVDWLDGVGTPEDPFQIEKADQLLLLHKYSLLLNKHFILNADIDLDPNLPDRDIFRQAVIPVFKGSFVGNGHVILNLQIEGGGYLGLFGKIIKDSMVRDLGLINISVNGIGSNIGGLVGHNGGGYVLNCYSSGSVRGDRFVGGLVGSNHGDMLNCYSTSTTSGYRNVGGLVGSNWGAVTACYSNATVCGENRIGGLVGDNDGDVTHCYSTSPVCGSGWSVGGLVGSGNNEDVTNCFWDIQTSGQITSDGGMGKTTAEMQMAETFLEADWDFVGEAENGTEDIWLIVEGQDYPRLKELPEGLWLWPHLAFCPDPQDGAIDVTLSPVLYWASANPTMQHDIYLGEGKQAVANATTSSLEIYRGRQPGDVTSHDAGILEWGKTYYWRIDEVDEADPNSPWKGNVWSFTTANFLIVDDFESYNDLDEGQPGSNRIYLTWIDGFDNPEINGSIVGYTVGWGTLEHRIVHGGLASMPYSYDNAVGISEATASMDNLEIDPDWTVEGVRVLSLWFRGTSANAPESMYVALANRNSSPEVAYHDNPDAVLIDTWTEWTIELQEFSDLGVDLTNINTISIGFGDKNNPQVGGLGKMWFDDIRLYRPAL